MSIRALGEQKRRSSNVLSKIRQIKLPNRNISQSRAYLFTFNLKQRKTILFVIQVLEI